MAGRESGPAVPVPVLGAPAEQRRPERPPSRRPAVALLLVPVLLLAVLAVRDTHRRARVQEARTAAGLRWTVVSARADPLTQGVPGSPIQQGIATLALRNDKGTRVRVLSAQLDGGGPASPGPGLVEGRRVASLSVAWRVLCAEVGNTPGPRLLQLRVRLRSAATYTSDVSLPGAVTDPAFHSAVISACDVLVVR